MGLLERHRNWKYRWKGQIYCRVCGLALARIELPNIGTGYDQLTGLPLTPSHQGGLMVCPYEQNRDWSFWWPHMDTTYVKHSVYYTNKPALNLK